MARSTDFYITCKQVWDKLNILHEKGKIKGSYIGFNSLQDKYSVKLGCTTYILGIPGHGKSEWLFEILINLSEFYGWRHIIYSPETGTATDIFLELAIKYCKKPLKQISKDDFHKATAFLDEYFYVLNPKDDEKTPDKLFDLALKVKKEYLIDEKTFHTFSIDPWNELSHDFTQYNGREDKYLAYMLGHIRQKSKENGIHTFIVAHPRTLREKKNDQSYSPPTTYEFSGGAEWFNKAETILCVYRPKIYDNDTKEYFNDVKIIIQKAKPKGIGCNKGEIELFYDTEKNRYYEKIDGNELFANKQSTTNEVPF